MVEQPLGGEPEPATRKSPVVKRRQISGFRDQPASQMSMAVPLDHHIVKQTPSAISFL